jgi:hypothetical protein
MLLSLAAAALFSAAAAPFAVTTDQLPNLFISACLDGKAQASDWSASPIGFEGLPSEVRGHLGKPSEAQVWQVPGSTPAYLYSLRYTDRAFSPRICGIASESLAIRPAAAAVETRLYGRPRQSDRAAKSTEWLNDAAGYRALATRKGKFTVLQVNWLTEDHQAEAPTPQ